MVKVNDALLQTRGSSVHLGILFTFLPCQAVYPKKVAVSRLYHMFFCRVSVGSAYGYKVGRVSDGGRDD